MTVGKLSVRNCPDRDESTLGAAGELMPVEKLAASRVRGVSGTDLKSGVEIRPGLPAPLETGLADGANRELLTGTGGRWMMVLAIFSALAIDKRAGTLTTAIAGVPPEIAAALTGCR